MKSLSLLLRPLLPVIACISVLNPTTLVGQTASAAPKPEEQKSDVLVFTNGDQLTGKLVRGSNGSVVFHSDMAGDVTVPFAKVKELRTAGAFAVLRKGAPLKESEAIQPEPIVILAAGVEMQSASGQPPVPLKQVALIIDSSTYEKDLRHAPNLLQGWNGAVNLGTTFVQSTQHGGTLTAGAQLVRQVPLLTELRTRNRTTVNVQETYGVLSTPALPNSDAALAPTPASTVKTSIFHADAERDEYFRKELYALGSVALDHNFSQGLQLQQIYGGGIGYTPVKSDVQQLDLKADVHYEKQAFVAAASNQNLFGSTFAENYRRTLPRKLVLTETASFVPAWNNENALAAHGAVGFVMPVLKRLSLNANVVDDFLRNPAPGYQQNSLQFVTGLAYTLK